LIEQKGRGMIADMNGHLFSFQDKDGMCEGGGVEQLVKGVSESI
jgi:hypothetical protein